MARVKIGNVRTSIDYLKDFFAPAGYGLGKPSVPTSNLNTAVKCGWYSFGNNCENRPFNYGVALAFNRYDIEILQIAFDVSLEVGNQNGAIARRMCLNDVWGEWEYLNPPMATGVEYRTAERFKEKPVYRKIVPYNLPESTNTDFTVPHGINDFNVLVRQTASVQAGTPLPYTHNGYTTCVYEVDSSNIKVSNSGQLWDASYTWNFYLYYTKTTD